MDLASIAQWVGIASSSALVVSVCLLAYNLMVSRKDARRNLAFSMMEQLTSSEFAARRFRMRQAITAALASNWSGFDDGLEDLECRAFAYQYELIGQMVAAGTLDYRLVRDFLQYSVVADWIAFDPLDARLVSRYPGHASPWERFHDLAERITTELNGPPIPRRDPSSAPAPGAVH
ncbi:MAG TPA: hypothetical protein VEY07_06115 [Thermoplasmata archaeon]|nr:hypothetical protein [Thermoplasmata archaeon]